jgi:hypothetical protein
MANYHTEGDTIDATAALKFINEWLLMDLGRDAGVVDSESIVVATADEWKTLPVDFIEETEITKDGDPYWGKFYGVEYRGDYDIRNSQIRLPYTGTYVVHHIRRPAVIALIGDTPEVNAVFHYCGSIYVAMRYKYYDDEDSKDAQRLRAEYDFYKNKAVLEFKKMSKSTTKASSIVRTRAWR